MDHLDLRLFMDHLDQRVDLLEPLMEVKNLHGPYRQHLTTLKSSICKCSVRKRTCASTSNSIDHSTEWFFLKGSTVTHTVSTWNLEQVIWVPLLKSSSTAVVCQAQPTTMPINMVHQHHQAATLRIQSSFNTIHTFKKYGIRWVAVPRWLISR